MRFTEKAASELAAVLKENAGKVLRVVFKGYG
jgi:Fe-S cluster assembly iron-binding protein IscA